MKPAVLHTYRVYYPDAPGGLQEAIRQISYSTQKYGCQNHIFTLSEQPQPKVIDRPEARVIREKSWLNPASCNIGGYASLRTFQQAAEDVDVLHYHFPWPFSDVLHALAKPSMPAVMTYHSDIIRQRLLGKLYQPLMHKMLNSMQAIVATSPAYVDSSPILSQPEIRQKVSVIPLGIDESTYTKESDGGIFNRSGINTDEPYFLFLGVLRYYKGLHLLIQAAAKTKAQIVIAGSGPEYAKLQAQVKVSNLTNVIFTGQVTEQEKVALLKQCYALVLPSHLRSEAFGMVLVEAAMFGKPMISCEIGTGTSYVNQDGETGLVVSHDDATALAHAMGELLRDESLVQQMGQAARKRYETNFSGDVMGKAYQSIYNELS